MYVLEWGWSEETVVTEEHFKKILLQNKSTC